MSGDFGETGPSGPPSGAEPCNSSRKRWRTSPSGRRHLAKEHARVAAQRATMARIERDYPGSDVIGDGVFAPRRDVIWFRFPGGRNPAAWQNNEEVTLAPADLAAWYEFERHCAAGRPQ